MGIVDKEKQNLSTSIMLKVFIRIMKRQFVTLGNDVIQTQKHTFLITFLIKNTNPIAIV